MQKKSKNWQPWKIFISLKTTWNTLKFVRNTICAVHDKFQVGISKKEVGHFSRNLWPRICKKVKKLPIFKKIFFRSKQPKTP